MRPSRRTLTTGRPFLCPHQVPFSGKPAGSSSRGRGSGLAAGSAASAPPTPLPFPCTIPGTCSAHTCNQVTFLWDCLSALDPQEVPSKHHYWCYYYMTSSDVSAGDGVEAGGDRLPPMPAVPVPSSPHRAQPPRGRLAVPRAAFCSASPGRGHICSPARGSAKCIRSGLTNFKVGDCCPTRAWPRSLTFALMVT